jgi:hypothetical protein
MPPRRLGPCAPLLSTAYGSLPYQFGRCCACLSPAVMAGSLAVRSTQTRVPRVERTVSFLHTVRRPRLLDAYIVTPFIV